MTSVQEYLQSPFQQPHKPWTFESSNEHSHQQDFCIHQKYEWTNKYSMTVMIMLLVYEYLFNDINDIYDI